MVPAWIASRTDVSAALKKGSRGAAGDRSRHLFRKALIVSELALALILLSGAGYFVRGMQRIADADMGWRPDGLITASMSLPFNANYQTDDQCRAFFDRLGSKLAQLPGATDVAISATLPVPGFWRSDTFLVEGRPAPARGKEPLAYYNSVTPGHFSTLGIRVLQGRDFSSADRADTQPVVIINESMARNLWPKENPIGKRIGSADPAHPGWMAVVGVVNDVHTAADLVRSPDSRFQAYRPINQTPSQFVHWLGLAIRSSAPERDVATALRAAVQQIDPDQPVYEVATARDSLEQFTRGFSLTSEMLGAFALIGLVLSAVGIYGVIANLVAQRTSEIGIRMALGAQARDVLWLVLAQGVRMAIFGTAVGVACAWGLIRLLDAILPAIPGGDPVAVALIALLLAAVALFACWLPARRATRIDPIIALRSE
jgi:predicted permease